ncbi:MAG: glycosyltransferase family 2 protein [bacterium]|nr:glycosyltransferase family 2 protein [bacterium]MDI1334683.1 glycosyltransferase family 2 protein [Lacunisphaera sp.]
MTPSLSFVIPLYYSAETITPLVKEIEGLVIEGGHELVLVNDGSRDATAGLCRELLRDARIPITFVNHARNFGEHNAVLTGYRHARGAYIVNLDDDGQNPPAEAVRLWSHAKAEGLDVVYGHYAHKEHSVFRNFGSWVTNRMTDWVLDKPKGFYLSSFRCVSAFVAKEVAAHEGPYPYIDGLILQVTQNIGAIEVHHAGRAAGQSGYTLRRLLRLWLSTFVNFSVMPLRLATLLGLVMGAVGLAGLGIVFFLWATNRGPDYGWGSLMGALLVFSGAQLVMLGLIGEYLGRMFLTVNRRPQSVVRSVERAG